MTCIYCKYQTHNNNKDVCFLCGLEINGVYPFRYTAKVYPTKLENTSDNLQMSPAIIAKAKAWKKFN